MKWSYVIVVGTLLLIGGVIIVQMSRDPMKTSSVNTGAISKFTRIQLFFVNTKLDPAVSCDKTFPVSRMVEKNTTPIQNALLELFGGPSLAEEQKGYTTSINSGVRVQSVLLQDGVARVDLSKEIERNVGGSCRVGSIRSQIANTVKQFPEVKSVIISVDGRVDDALQP